VAKIKEQMRLRNFLSPTEGILGKKGKLSYKVDVLPYQSLVRKGDREEVLDRYGMVVDYVSVHPGTLNS